MQVEWASKDMWNKNMGARYLVNRYSLGDDSQFLSQGPFVR